jgi:ubiquinone/menaquinone biosynthesis C-methylase UbiE
MLLQNVIGSVIFLCSRLPAKEQAMHHDSHHVIPLEHAGRLERRWRKFLQNPRRILRPFVKEGMTVLDMGCGPGFFSIEAAKMAGQAGRVIGVDLQEGMLARLREKIAGTELEKRFTLHRCAENRIGVAGPIDFFLAFYVVHEVPDAKSFFAEVYSLLKPGCRMLVAEPAFRVSKPEFEQTVRIAREAGFTIAKGPLLMFSRTAVLVK